MLTIGRLAATAGTTVRAVRHYHRIGLLPEPERDASGYRRYGAEAVVALIRIRTLAEAGVPLARIDALLAAGPDAFAAAIAEIDAELQRKIRRLAESRRRIAELSEGDALLLPPEATEVLDRMRALGIGALRVGVEREAWILMQALDPAAVPRRAREKQAELDDPRALDLYLACDRAFAWDPDDPRIDGLAAELAAAAAEHGVNRGPGDLSHLVASRIAAASPAWRRIVERLSARHP